MERPYHSREFSPMSAYEEFRPTEDYADLNPQEDDPRTWRYAICGESGEVNLWLFCSNEVKFSETFRGPAAHVRALHFAEAWLQYAASLKPVEWQVDRTRRRGPA